MTELDILREYGVPSIRNYAMPSVDRREVFRYAGVYGNVPELEKLLDECLSELDGRLSYKVCARAYRVSSDAATVSLGFASLDSQTLKKRLSGCGTAVVFAATVGLELDRLIAKYSRIIPSRALMLQAIGAERIEALCDAFCTEIGESAAADGYYATSRFSPGYGDIPITFQRAVFDVLDCERRLGITLNESFLMSPSKSVTALLGIKKHDGEMDL